jgi:hypothetical protein
VVFGTTLRTFKEKCRLLGYKTPVRMSQETHFVSATEPSRLMLCKIWDFHGGDHEEWRLVRCYAVLALHLTPYTTELRRYVYIRRSVLYCIVLYLFSSVFLHSNILTRH